MASPFQTWVGTTVHMAIASALIAGIDPHDIDAVFRVAVATINHHRFGSRRARILVASRLRLYLRAFIPPGPWRLLGAEMPVGNGRVDLCWVLEEWLSDRLRPGVILFDEVKVSSLAWVIKDSAARAQARRYEADGEAAFGKRLLGTRVVALAEPAGVVLTDRLAAWSGDLPWLAGRGRPR